MSGSLGEGLKSGVKVRQNLGTHDFTSFWLFFDFNKFNNVNIIVYICRYFYRVQIMCICKFKFRITYNNRVLHQKSILYAECIVIASHGKFIHIA